MTGDLEKAIETVIDELIQLEVDAADDRLAAIGDEIATGDRTYDGQALAILDGIRWGCRASVSVELAGGAMVRVILPYGERITHEWGIAKDAEPAIKAALEAIADHRAQDGGEVVEGQDNV